MTDNEEEVYEEETEYVRPPMRNYEIVMKTVDATGKREVFNFYGLLGLNPGFVLLQSEEGYMKWASEWSSVLYVRAKEDAAVVSLAVN